MCELRLFTRRTTVRKVRDSASLLPGSGTGKPGSATRPRNLQVTIWTLKHLLYFNLIPLIRTHQQSKPGHHSSGRPDPQRQY